MNEIQQTEILGLLKVLADKHRLTMIRLMSDEERTVTQMAEILQVTEPTVSHHVSKLHEAGFVTLRMAGNQRFYRTNARRFDQFCKLAAQINTPLQPEEVYIPDNTWIDALDISVADKKVLRDYTDSRKLKQIPTKNKKWIVILRWIATHFKPDIRYTEKQVNAIIKEIHPDYATTRRDLIGFGFMHREPGGGDYWLAQPSEVRLTPIDD